MGKIAAAMLWPLVTGLLTMVLAPAPKKPRKTFRSVPLVRHMGVSASSADRGQGDRYEDSLSGNPK